MILVSGAEGNVGGELIRTLVGAGEGVTGLVRDRQAHLPEGVGARIGDLNRPASLRKALDGVRAVFLLSGFADMPGLLSEIRRAGAEQVVLLSSGAVVGGERSNAITRYNMVSEEATRTSGVRWTILRPSGYMSNALRWVPQLEAGNVVREPFADVAIAAIDPADIAAVAAVALTSPGHEGRSYRLTGPEAILPADRVQALAALLGRDLRFQGLSDAEARAQMTGTMPVEYIDAFFRYFSDGTYDDSVVHATVHEITGGPPRTFPRWAAANADAFR